MSVTSPSTIRASKHLAAAFRAEGARDVFGLMGDGNMEFVSYFTDLAGCRFHPMRHESMAVAAADGFARLSGEVGVATVTMGPGLTHTATALVTAARRRTPLVVLTARAAAGAQAFEQGPFVESCESRWLLYRSPQDVGDAFHLARTARRPVVLGVPLAEMEREIPGAVYLPPPRPRPSRVAPNAEDLRAAAEIIASSRRPIVLAGRGAVGAAAALDGLCALLGAPLATSLLAKGELERGPHAIGTAGGYSTAAVAEAFREADCVIAVGASLNRLQVRGGHLFPSAKVVHIDLAAGAVRVAQPVVADAELGVRALVAVLGELGAASRPPWAGHAGDGLDAELAAYPSPVEPDRVDPRLLMRALDRALPDDAVVVTDNGHFHAFPGMYLGPGASRHFEVSSDFGSIGLGLPLAIGAAMAQPSRTVALFVGDGGLMQCLQELDTARACSNLVVVALNDSVLGAEYHKLAAKGLPPERSAYPRIDFAGVARLLGLRGGRAGSPEEAARLVAERAADGPATLIEVPISLKVVSRYFRDHVLAGLGPRR